MSEPKRLAILISGGGTTMKSVLDACRDGVLTGLYEPVGVIASKEEAGGLQKAQDWGLPQEQMRVIKPPSRRKLSGEAYDLNRALFGESLLDQLREWGAETVAQLGWLPQTPPVVVSAYKERLINQHPAPLDPGSGGRDFGGQGMYGRRAIAACLFFMQKRSRGERFIEATSHYVEEGIDTGALLHISRVDIHWDDTVESLQQRLLPVEHITQIEALYLLAIGRAKPHVRLDALLEPHEYPLLERAKIVAANLYPHG